MPEIKTVRSVVFIYVLLFLFSCASQQTETYNLEFNTRLLDGKKAKIVFEISFENRSSITELNKHLKKVKYALTIVFSKMTAEELTAKNGESTKNSLFLILKENFKITPQKIEISELKFY